MSPPSTSIVTITYEDDLRLTVLQVLSIDRLFTYDDLEEYIIVLNGKDNAGLQVALRCEIQDKVSGKLADKIRFLDARDVIGSRNGVGWRDQQLIKLLVARNLSSEYYLILDGKNHFVRNSSLDEFFSDGRPLNTLMEVKDYWRPYIKWSMIAYGLSPDEDMPRLTFPTVTPYVMIRDEVLAAVDRLELRFKAPLLDSFEARMGKATEFYLYWAHLYSIGRIGLYASGPSLAATLYTKWPQNPDVVLRVIGEAGGRAPVFGLHRKRLPQLSEDQKCAIRKLWGRQLLNDQEDADWFLHASVAP